MLKLSVGSSLALLLTSLSVGVADDEGEKADALARGAAQQFVKSMLAQDLKGVMKVVDTPWCHDGERIIKDNEKLQEEFLKEFEQPYSFADAKIHIRAIATLEQLREKKKGPPARDVSLGEVLGKDDLAVLVELEKDGRFQPLWLGVRLGEGEAKVVGAVE